jgi:hypothetical protein
MPSAADRLDACCRPEQTVSTGSMRCLPQNWQLVLNSNTAKGATIGDPQAIDVAAIKSDIMRNYSNSASSVVASTLVSSSEGYPAVAL